MTPPISLGNFIKYLLVMLHDLKVKIPAKQEPWHLLLYRLKSTAFVPFVPDCLANLRYNWDGPYPKADDLSYFLHALHWNAAIDIRDNAIVLSDEMANLWRERESGLDGRTKDMLEKALGLAVRDWS